MATQNKIIRDRREFEGIFRNPKHARATWAQAVCDRYAKPALEPVPIYDKNGCLTPESQLELAVWKHLLSELQAEGSTRLPTEGEMMEACQQYYARHNAAAYTARRDTAGAKPVDETKQNLVMTNPLESMSDDELQVMLHALEAYHANDEDDNA